MSTAAAANENDSSDSSTTTKIEGIYISSRSMAPMEFRQSARLIPGKGIDGDRYALGTGTYSARFMSEPGKNLTMISLQGIMEATERTGMESFDNDMGELRRNIVLNGISASELNDMIGHEVKIGNFGCRVFVHRRCVPCKYREGACKRPGLMNNLWGVSGVNCEVLPNTSDNDNGDNYNIIKVGDEVSVIPNTYQPERIDVGRKPPGFFIRPADRTPEDQKNMIKPPYIGGIAYLIDPEGFQRVEDAYNSVGHRFWSPEAYSVGMRLKALRFPILLTMVVTLSSIVIAIITD